MSMPLNVGFGTLQIGNLFIPAFGPQALPLSDLNQFGIYSNNFEETDWFCAYGEREAWVHFRAEISPQNIQLHFQCIGNDTLRIAFYVQAKECSLRDGTMLLPGDLRCFDGIREAHFDRMVHVRSLENKMQIIPLSGSNYFWNATFIIALEFSKTHRSFNSSYLELILDLVP